MQRREEPVARAVAGEHAPGAVGAVRRRRQADDHQAARRGRRTRARRGPSSTWPAYDARPVRATSSRHRTRRGQRRHAATPAARRPRSPSRRPVGRHGAEPTMGLRARVRPIHLLTHALPAAAARRPPATVVLLVRHGTTPTTGKILPGQAPGLHLSEKGHAQAAAAAERIAGHGQGARRRLRLAARAHPGDGGPHRPGPRPAGARRRRPHRGRRGRLDREAAGPAVPGPASGPPCNAGRAGSGSPAASPSPRCRCAPWMPSSAWWPSTRARRSWPSRTPTPSRRSWPRRPGVPLDLMQRLVISPCSISALLFTAGRPPGAVRELDRVPGRAGAVVTGRP